MATARELLEQADALMRRNRAAAGGAAPIAAEAPGLVEIARTGTTDAANGSRGEAARAANVAARSGNDAVTASAKAANAPLDDFDDIPVLTDAVTDREPISVLGGPEYSGEPSVWPEDAVPKPRYDDWSAPPEAEAPPDERRAESAAAESTEGDAPVPLDDDELRFTVEPIADAAKTPAAEANAAADDVAPQPSLFADALPIMVPAGIGDAAPHGPPATGEASAADRLTDEARWDALAEEVRIQVLQRLDIFTDTGLQEQLTARLQPIVDRASNDLVAAINQHLGALLRSYVAEAIEREIEKLRRGNN